MFKTNDFDFSLPSNLIAHQPRQNKEQTPLLIFKNNEIFDKKVINLIDYFCEGDVMIFNQVKVIKAKLRGTIERTKSTIDFNLDQEIDGIWQALCRPAKKINDHDKIILAKNFFCIVVEKKLDGFIKIQFYLDNHIISGKELHEVLEIHGSTPLPPYIKRDDSKKNYDSKNYQTLYAKDGAGVAAPTAGLHFNEEIFKKIVEKKIKCVFLTLNVGAGTFLPVRSETLDKHQMHSEKYVLSAENCEIINHAKKLGKKIIAVGTTSLRALESSVDSDGFLQPQNRTTDIFIYPPYDFKIVDVLMTNFHLPKSTLFMLVCAFVGYENAFKIYRHAIEQQYRFYSYGDTSLLFKSNLINK